MFIATRIINQIRKKIKKGDPSIEKPINYYWMIRDTQKDLVWVTKSDRHPIYFA